MPDLNSVPASPHGLGSSRRQSNQQMPPPPQPVSGSPSLNILPSNQNALNQQNSTAVSSSVPSPQLTAAQPAVAQGDSNAASGPGPLRHPRPLTASEMHSQLEKEQEALVRRLHRSSLADTRLTYYDRSTDLRANSPSCEPLIMLLQHPTPRLRQQATLHTNQSATRPFSQAPDSLSPAPAVITAHHPPRHRATPFPPHPTKIVEHTSLDRRLPCLLLGRTAQRLDRAKPTLVATHRQPSTRPTTFTANECRSRPTLSLQRLAALLAATR